MYAIAEVTMLAHINPILHLPCIHIQRTGPTNSLMGLFVGIGIVAAFPATLPPSLVHYLVPRSLAPIPLQCIPKNGVDLFLPRKRPDIRAVAAAEKAYEPYINDVRVRNITTPHCPPPCLFLSSG